VLETVIRYGDAFACLPQNAVKARRAVRRFASMWLAGSDLSDFELAAGEVLSNMVHHGKSHWITVHCYLERDRIVMELRNYGHGFSPPQRFEPPERGAVGGYGLFLMYTLLDDLEIRDLGRHIRLAKNLQSAPFQR
jgi:anti-sigma regulatory factor (Ser/Thr protein kinase)